MARPIDGMHVFLVTNDDGDEGIAAYVPPARKLQVPMIASSPERLEQLMAIARDMVEQTGRPMTLAYFLRKRDVEVIAREASTLETS